MFDGMMNFSDSIRIGMRKSPAKDGQERVNGLRSNTWMMVMQVMMIVRMVRPQVVYTWNQAQSVIQRRTILSAKCQMNLQMLPNRCREPTEKAMSTGRKGSISRGGSLSFFREKEEQTI